MIHLKSIKNYGVRLIVAITIAGLLTTQPLILSAENTDRAAAVEKSDKAELTNQAVESDHNIEKEDHDNISDTDQQSVNESGGEGIGAEQSGSFEDNSESRRDDQNILPDKEASIKSDRDDQKVQSAQSEQTWESGRADQSIHASGNNQADQSGRFLPGGSTSQLSLTPAASRLVCSGRDLTFNQQVEKGDYLPRAAVPGNLLLKGNKTSIRLSWTKPSAADMIDGYIILRKTGSSKRYYQIAQIASSKTFYTDKTANKKNVLYTYCIVSCKYDRILRISADTTDWVSGVTSAGKKVNVYKAGVANQAQLKNVSAGDKIKIKLKFPAKAVKKTVRWSSSNLSVASVNSKGVVKAANCGNAYIMAKLISGRVVKIKVHVVKGGTAKAMLSVMKSWLSYSEANKKHRKIIDIYNSYGNLPVGYKVRYSDAWCDTCVSAAAIISGNVSTIGRECGVLRHVELFKKKKIWIENGSIVPKPGYLIVYNWGKSKQPNNSGANHIGVVYSVKKGWITTVEGNYRDSVKKRRIPVGWGYIRGYARPKYK